MSISKKLWVVLWRNCSFKGYFQSMALGSARPEIVKYEEKYNVLTRRDSYLMLMITHDILNLRNSLALIVAHHTVHTLPSFQLPPYCPHCRIACRYPSAPTIHIQERYAQIGNRLSAVDPYLPTNHKPQPPIVASTQPQHLR